MKPATMRPEEISLMSDMRSAGITWRDIEKKMGYSINFMRQVYRLAGGYVANGPGRRNVVSIRLHPHELDSFQARGGTKWLRQILGEGAK